MEKPTEEGVADGDKLEQNGEAASNGFISYHRVVHCLYVIIFLKIKLTQMALMNIIQNVCISLWTR